MSEGLEARRRDSQVAPGLVCPRCGRGLLVFSGSRTLNFYCKSGHDWSLQNLLRSPSQYIRVGVGRLREEWRRKALALRNTVTQAQLEGHSDLADAFRREATTLEAGIRILTAGLEKASGDPRHQSAIETT